MGLNIKSEETHRLAAQLAALTGESMTSAVTKAIQERIERIQRQRDVAEIVARALALVRDSGGREAYEDPADLLYDDHGLPR